MSRTHTIRGRKYADEQTALREDPIIQQMAADLKDHVARSGDHDFLDADGEPTWWFIRTASAGYRNLGGTHASSIGGPAEAITSLITD